MARRHIVLNVLLILLLLLTACHKSDSSVTSAPSSISQETSSTGFVSLEDDPSPTVIWAVHATAYISEGTQAEIQRFLDDKGINCRIEFTPLLVQQNESYIEWLDKQKKEGTTPDILSGSYWQQGIVDLVPFVKKELAPLNDYLEADIGKTLYDSYAEVEWNRTAVDGVIYAIPFRVNQYQNTQGEFYLCVNDGYKAFFDAGFDGTYASLRKIMETIPGSPKIAMVPCFGINCAASLFQTQTIFNASYDWERNEIVDLTKQKDFKELLLDIYADYQRGVLVDIETVEQVNGKACAYIGFSGAGWDHYDIPEGYTEYMLAPQKYLSTPGGGSYGISAFSEKKDLAFQVLSACYSDPKIASLLFWGTSDEVRWNERTHFLRTCASSPLNSFIPDITKEEFSILQSYNNDLNALGREFYLEQGGRLTLNPNYSNVVEQFFASPKDYGGVLEKVNDQIREWIDKK